MSTKMGKDYAEQRAAILRDLDGLQCEVDATRKVGFLWLDRPPLNVVSYRGRYLLPPPGHLRPAPTRARSPSSRTSGLTRRPLRVGSEW